MPDIERWKTTRRCHDCLEKGNTNYLWAQKWGTTQLGKQEYKLNCIEGEGCNFYEYTTWEGR